MFSCLLSVSTLLSGSRVLVHQSSSCFSRFARVLLLFAGQKENGGKEGLCESLCAHPTDLKLRQRCAEAGFGQQCAFFAPAAAFQSALWGLQDISVHMPKDNVRGPNNQQENWTFKFDHLLHNATQEAVYDTAARDIVENVLSGFNGTILACARVVLAPRISEKPFMRAQMDKLERARRSRSTGAHAITSIEA